MKEKMKKRGIFTDHEKCLENSLYTFDTSAFQCHNSLADPDERIDFPG